MHTLFLHPSHRRSAPNRGAVAGMLLVLIAVLLGCSGSANSPVAPSAPALSAAAPTTTEVWPAAGLISGGTVVTITGTGFREGATVTFGGTPAVGVRVISSTSMTAITPAHAAGDVDVVVVNPGGRTSTSIVRYRYITDDSDPCNGCWDY
jgi:IPT/TIG domain-containing protein